MRTSVLLLLLAACDRSEPLTTDRLPPPLAFDVTPIEPGMPVTFSVAGALPGDTLYIARGNALGPAGCPSLFQGACLQIRNAQPLTTGVADADGMWSWTVQAPSFLAPGSTIALQAFAVGTTGVASSPISRIIIDPDGEADCADGRDDDYDGLADCADLDCEGIGSCPAGPCDLGSCCHVDDEVIDDDGIFQGALRASDPTDGPGGIGRAYDDVEFTGAAGEVLNLHIAAELPIKVQLQNDNCGTIGRIDAPAGVFDTPITLPYDGNYTLVMTALQPGDLGGYTLSLGDFTPPGVGDVCFTDINEWELPIVSTGTLDAYDAFISGPLGLGHVYEDMEFMAYAGERVAFTIATQDRVAMSLMDDSCTEIERVEAPFGTNTLVVDIPTDGIYTFTLSMMDHSQFLTEDYEVSGAFRSTTPLGSHCLTHPYTMTGSTTGTTADNLTEGGVFGWGHIYEDIEFTRDAGPVDIVVDADFASEAVLLDEYCQEIWRSSDPTGLIEDTITLPRDETYTMVVSSMFPGDVGTYSIDLEEPSTGCATGTCCFTDVIEIFVGQTISGSLATTDEYGVRSYIDDYEIYLNAGQTITIDAQSTEIDNFLFLYDEDCRLLAFDDDGGFEQHDSLLTFTATNAGTYVIVSGAYGSSETGAYSLSVY